MPVEVPTDPPYPIAGIDDVQKLYQKLATPLRPTKLKYQDSTQQLFVTLEVQKHTLSLIVSVSWPTTNPNSNVVSVHAQWTRKSECPSRFLLCAEHACHCPCIWMLRTILKCQCGLHTNKLFCILCSSLLSVLIILVLWSPTYTQTHADVNRRKYTPTHLHAHTKPFHTHIIYIYI